jgi:PIN domain nuclease of toxin-antitoxin system
VSGYLLDTHVWLWVQLGEVRKFDLDILAELEKRQRRRQLYISAISVLEIARLVALKQYSLNSSIDDFIAEATTDDGFTLQELTPRILIESTRPPGGVHRDPFDRILIATAREHDLTLLTRDKDILLYARQGHLKARKP